MTSVADSERLGHRSHVLLVGVDFPDGFSAPRPPPEAAEPLPPAPTAPEAPLWEPRCGEKVYFHRQRLCLTQEKGL